MLWEVSALVQGLKINGVSVKGKYELKIAWTLENNDEISFMDWSGKFTTPDNDKTSLVFPPKSDEILNMYYCILTTKTA